MYTKYINYDGAYKNCPLQAKVANCNVHIQELFYYLAWKCLVRVILEKPVVCSHDFLFLYP